MSGGGMTWLRMIVRKYHEKMHADHLGYTVDTLPADLLAFRRRLHDEEVREVTEAWDNVAMGPGAYDRDEALAHLLHELADVVIVAYGTADYLGVNFDEVLVATMQANMGKVPPTEPGGKATKPPGWVRADGAIEEIVRKSRGALISAGSGSGKAADQFAQPSGVVRSAARSSLSDVGPVFTARYDSECGSCGNDLEAGERARMVDGEAVHEECAE